MANWRLQMRYSTTGSDVANYVDIIIAGNVTGTVLGDNAKFVLRNATERLNRESTSQGEKSDNQILSETAKEVGDATTLDGMYDRMAAATFVTGYLAALTHQAPASFSGYENMATDRNYAKQWRYFSS